MPAIIPTPDELARLTPQQRNKIRRYIAKVATEIDQVARDLAEAEERRRRNHEWGEAIRQHARHLEAARTPEPPHVIEARRRTLLDATE